MNVADYLREAIRRKGDKYINIYSKAEIPKEFVEKYAKMYDVEIEEME